MTRPTRDPTGLIENRGGRSVGVYILIALATQLGIALAANLNKWRQSAEGLAAQVEDTDIYFRYTTLAWGGKVPYRDFDVEYPPLAFPLFLAPRVLASDLASYKAAFAAEMLAFNAATVGLVAAWPERGGGRSRIPRRLAWYTLFFAALSRLIVSRYDAAAMFVAFAACARWSAGKPLAGGVLASVGTFTKVYPAALACVAIARDVTGAGGRRFRGAACYLGTSLLLLAAWLSTGGRGGVLRSVRYQLGRGLEYGSLYSCAQMLVAKALGAEIVISRDHGSFSSITPWSESIVTWVLPLQLAAILLVAWVFVRRGGREAARYAGAAVLALVLFGRVFSPQYLIWLIPFVAVLEPPLAPRAGVLFAAGCSLTLLSPSRSGFLSRTDVWLILAHTLKNALLVWLWALLVFGHPSRERTPEAGEGRLG